MATDVSIVNQALRRLGCEAISALSDSNNRAKVMNDLYDITRQTILQEYRWPFSLKRTTLSPNYGTTPAFEYSYAFDLPSDYLTTVEEYNEVEYAREGTQLLSNSDSLSIKYIADITDPSKYSPVFIKVFYLTLAKEASYSLVQDKVLKQELEAERKEYLMDARFSSSTESTAEDFDIDAFTDIRL